VYRAIPDLEFLVEIKDIEDPNNLEELLAIGKKGQVPCLVSNGVALYESDAIIASLTGSSSKGHNIQD
jgi:glutathione S-transferase